jgi:hypothetical protein
MLYDRALDEKNTCLSRLDSYRNFGLVAVTFAAATYIGTLTQEIDPFWRFALVTLSFVIVFHFFMLETINIMYIWTYNSVIEETQKMLTSDNLNRIMLLMLTQSMTKVRRIKSCSKTVIERIRTPFFTFLVVTKVVWLYELYANVNWSNYQMYLLIILLYLLWWGYEIWNVVSYPLFSYRQPVRLEEVVKCKTLLEY